MYYNPLRLCKAGLFPPLPGLHLLPKHFEICSTLPLAWPFCSINLLWNVKMRTHPCINTALNVTILSWFLNFSLHSDYHNNHNNSYYGYSNNMNSLAGRWTRCSSVCCPVFQITGALQPLNVSVHHIQSHPGDIYAGTVASQLLLGMHHHPAPLAEVSSSLKAMEKRVYGVIDTEVQGHWL